MKKMKNEVVWLWD